MTTPARTYQGQTAAARVAMRQRQLRDTGLSLMSAGLWSSTTIDSLCRAAKLHKRYFYESFKDLDALAKSVVDDLVAQLIVIGIDGATAAQQMGLATETIALQAMSSVLRWLVEDPRRARVLFQGQPEHRPCVTRQLSEALAAFGLSFHGAAAPHPLAKVGSALLMGGSIEVLIAWLDGAIDLSLEALIESLALLWVQVGSHCATQAQQCP